MSANTETAFVDTASEHADGLAFGSRAIQAPLSYRHKELSPESVPIAVTKDRSRIRDVWDLAKPEISFLVVISALAGYLLGSPGSFDFLPLLAALAGIGLTCGGAASLNHYTERDLDALMRRTADRPLPSGRLAPAVSLVFSFATLGIGFGLLFAFVNVLTGVLAAITVILYVLIYTPLKRTTKHNTLIGAVPGALPALGGFTAATGALEPAGWVLFALLFVWQMPHFLSLAWMYRADYARAGFAMLPVVEPSGRSTARLTLLYTAALIGVSIALFFASDVGLIYLAGALILGLMFLRDSYRFYRSTTAAGARKVLVASIVYIPVLVACIFVDRILPF